MHIYEKINNDTIVPQHFTTSSKGSSRASTLRDFKKWLSEGREVRPSVTTIMSMFNKEGLNLWRIREHILTAYNYQFAKSEQKYAFMDDFVDAIIQETKERLDEAPKARTDFHDKIHNYIDDELYPDDKDYDLCESIINLLFDSCNLSEDAKFYSEKNFITSSYGGQADLLIIDKNNNWIIDFKTKQHERQFKAGKMAYPEHAMQLSAYRVGLDKKDAKCANVFICLENGDIDFCGHEEANLLKQYEIFSLAVKMWYLTNNINSSEE